MMNNRMSFRQRTFKTIAFWHLLCILKETNVVSHIIIKDNKTSDP